MPTGFHVTTAAYRRFVEANDLQAVIPEATARAQPDDPASLERASAAVRQLLRTSAVPDAISAAIHAGWIAGMFPQVNFEVLHPGFAFVDETAWLFARYPNVYVNLEWTVSCSPPRGASQRYSAT